MNQGTDIQIGKNPEFTGYLAQPPGGHGPGLLLFHAIFGVNDFFRAVADDFARQGYLALCPDLFWRQEPRVQLDEANQEDFQKGFRLYSDYDMIAGLEDLRTALNAIQGHETCTGRVGCVGYCFGGRLAYVLAAHTEVAAAVSYYGTAIENYLEDAPKVHRPLMLHLAEEDKFVPKEAQTAIMRALAGNPKVVIHVYPNVGHAFARLGGSNYDPDSANLANDRTIKFLAEHLQ